MSLRLGHGDVARRGSAAPSKRALRLARFPPAPRSNPYLDLLYGELRSFGVECVAEPHLSLGWLWRARHDVRILHFHWRPDKYYASRQPLPESIAHRPLPRLQGIRSWFTLVAFAGRIALARLLGYRVVWTIHEVYPPESHTRPPGSISRRIDRLGGRLLARSCDLLFAHDLSTRERARAAFGGSADRIEVIQHGSYIDVYPPGRPRTDVRREWGIPSSAFTFLCFGTLRPDKRIDLVLDAFCEIDDPDIALVVAGRVADPRPLHPALTTLSDQRIRTRLELVRHERVRELFEAVDAAVLGRSEEGTSGSLILALSMGVPAVAAALPLYRDLLGEAGWFFRPGDVGSLRDALVAAAADPGGAQAKGALALKRAEAIPSWSEIAEQTAAAMLKHPKLGRTGDNPFPLTPDL